MKTRKLSMLALAAIVLMAPGNGYAQARTYVRKNASNPEAQADLQALNAAMKIMRSRKCDDPTSWYYQGGIHWVPDDANDNSNLANGNPFCASYLGHETQLKPAWDNCTHGPNPEIHFLVWHRLYIYYLEDIVRTASKKTDFALPYWDYCDPAYRVMPASFLDESNSLYEKARYTPLNNGDPIDPQFAATYLRLDKLFQNRTYDMFNHSIDAAPHGAMHDYIGGGPGNTPESMFNPIYQVTNTGLMANVPSAAFDPIFWAHHSNIDYLWQQWMNSPYSGPLPVLEELEADPTGYNFFKPDGTAVNLTVAEAYKMAFSLPVTYDTMVEVNVASSEKQPPAKKPASPGKLVASALMARAVNQHSVVQSLKLTPEADSEGLLKVKGARAILHLTVSFQTEPHAGYEVFIRNDSDKKLDSPEQLAGVMTFFGAKHHAAHMADADDHKLTKEFRFDITDEIDVQKYDGNLDIQIRKSGEVAEAEQLTIEKVELKVR